MRIVNLMPNAQHFSYAGTSFGGRTITPGEESRELPFDRLLLDQLQKDVRTGKISIRLDAVDKEFIDELIAWDKRPIKVQQIPKKRKAQAKKKSRPKPQLDPAGHQPTTTPTPKGQPSISSVPPPGTAGNKGPLDLNQLMKQNEGLGA